MKSVFLTSLIGKIVAKSARIRGGEGSALPGLIVEKFDPNFLNKVLKNLPYGVVIISGTNGKTTTTKIVTELLRSVGLRVFTNSSGSNFTRGVASSAIVEMRYGKLHADIAILELDEAHAVHFVNKIAPKYSLLLNVSDDQKDRHGNVKNVANLLEKVANRTTKTVILNREDTLLSKISTKSTKYFGYSESIKKLFKNQNQSKKGPEIPAEIILEDFYNGVAKFNIGEAKLQIDGVHNALNAVAALALVKEILDEKFDDEKVLSALSKIKPASGRGEKIILNGQSIALKIVKNPVGFQMALIGQYDPNAATMIAINNHIADGRDISWLKDVDYSDLQSVEMISGTCADDMTKSLKDQGIKIKRTNHDLPVALSEFLSQNAGQPKQIFASYTAIMEIRKILKREIKK